MKKTLQLFLLTSILISYKSYAQRVSSSVSDVTVYLQGALVNRNVQATLTPGTTEMVIEGLSNYIDAGSIVLEGSGDATILSVNYRINHVKLQENNEAGRTLKAEMDSVRMKLAYVQNERMTLEEELQMLRTNHRVNTEDKGGFVDDLEDAADFIRSRGTEVRNRISRLHVTEADLNTKYANLQNQFNQDGNNNKLPSGEIVVKLSATSYTRTNFTLKYFVNQAGWVPSYTLRAEEMNQPLALNYDAMVMQRTGEQWKNVKLTLTTGTPAAGNIRPQFQPWYVNVYQPSPQFQNNAINKSGVYDSKRQLATRSEESVKESYSGDEVQAREVGYTSDYTSRVQGTTNVNFEINLKYDIPSDGVGRHVRVQQVSLPASFEYTTMPRQCNHAFLTANVTGWEEFGLLPGEASLFLGNTYVGKSFLDPNASADTMSLYFGEDKQIIVDRKKVKTSTRKQFLGSNKTETFSYVTTIRNAKNMPVTVDVIDQIPVSQNKDITVELKESSGAQYDEATGKLVWPATIQPGETKTLNYEYGIKYPKNIVIGNLY